MQAQKQKRIFEVTVGQIVIALLIAAIALTVVFEAGVLIGKRRGIKATLEAEQPYETQTRSPVKLSTEAKLPGGEPPDQPVEQPEPVEDQNPAEEVSTEPKQPEEALTEKIAQYTVQVGAFSSRQNAEGLVNLLKSYEYESWLKPGSVQEKTLYFVFAGRFGARDEADKFGSSLQNRLSHITEYKVSKMQDQN